MAHSARSNHWVFWLLLFVMIGVTSRFVLFADKNLAKESPLVVQGESMAPHYVSGQHLEVDFQATPKRWDAVLLRSPANANELLVKRVVGLPKERISILEGEVIINGAPLLKNLQHQKRLRVAVQQESKEAKSRWMAKHSAWHLVGKNWHCKPVQDDDIAVLSFEGEFTDDLPENQTISRVVNYVDDVMVTCQVELARLTTLEVKILGTRFILSPVNGMADQEREARIVTSEGSSVSSRLPLAAKKFHLTCSTFDGHANVAINEILVGSLHLKTKAKGQEQSPHLQITAGGEGVRIEELSVWRDVYYEDLNQLDGDTWQMGPDEWFVLGDNPPASGDSRNWDAPAGVSKASILGVVR